MKSLVQPEPGMLPEGTQGSICEEKVGWGVEQPQTLKESLEPLNGSDIERRVPTPPFTAINNSGEGGFNYSSPKSVSNHNSLPWLPATDS